MVDTRLRPVDARLKRKSGPDRDGVVLWQAVCGTDACSGDLGVMWDMPPGLLRTPAAEPGSLTPMRATSLRPGDAFLRHRTHRYALIKDDTHGPTYVLKDAARHARDGTQIGRRPWPEPLRRQAETRAKRMRTFGLEAPPVRRGIAGHYPQPPCTIGCPKCHRPNRVCRPAPPARTTER